ncbi:MAG: cysteine--tRNA ligase [Nitrospirae bacterium]|nr:cysteine--tRNA ligase [Nitrospirota bacterium]
MALLYNTSMGFWHEIGQDYKAVFERDPAVRSGLEIIFAYPGFHAIFLHRINHFLWNTGIPVIPRILSHLGRFLTGIEIHPGAKIKGGFFVDHGMGVVVGETSEIGENATLYQGVTLGGTGKEKGKRHPTLGNNVIVGTGAKILGAITIGDNVTIGANSVVLKSIPANSIVVGVPGRITRKKIIRMTTEEGLVEVMDSFPDPLIERIEEIESRLSELEKNRDLSERQKEKDRRMRIYNTLTGKKEEFVPINPGKVGMYVCGITAYDVCHLGHARSAIVFDAIKRYFRYRGFEVKHVRNITDIDDKIIARAQKENVTTEDIAKKYTDEYSIDMARLGVSKADVEPKATEYIAGMIDVINGLIAKGYAYSANGDVYFRVSRFSEYGKLSKRTLDEMMAGARVEVDEKKENPMDFALWKASKPGEPWWESPWGKGRPGWHIECTAMSTKHLGESFDIHGGGADLIFPHHENEIAQTEAFTGKPFVKYWLHNGFITVDKEKMSKSLGNFFTIKEILDKYDPEIVRYFLLSTHYRSPIEFSDAQLKEAEAAIDRYYTTVLRIEDAIQNTEHRAQSTEQKITEDFGKLISTLKEKFMDAMNDDFNTALALGHIFELIRETNKFLDSKPSGDKAKTLLANVKEALKEVGGVLNIFNRTPDEWYRSLMKIRNIGLSEQDILNKIAQRQEARQKKDWALADNVRKELDALGIILEDKKDSTRWKVRIS